METDLERLRAYCDGVLADNDTLRKEIERLIVERDHARRMACTHAIRMGGIFRRVENRTVECTTAREVAELMGWDCFKEATNGTHSR